MDATNKGTHEALTILLSAQRRAEQASELLDSVEAMLERAAKSLSGPEREKLLAIAASIPDAVDEIDTVLEGIAKVGAAIERETEGGAA